jgi:hypothetical protein
MAVLDRRQREFVELGATLLPSTDARPFFFSVLGRLAALRRPPSDRDVRRAVEQVLATRGIALGRGVLAERARP